MRRLGRCRIGALCAFEYVCFVLLDPAERLQPAERCATIVNRFAKPSGQASCALHPARTGRIAATALRHRRRSLRAALVHDLGHQADRLALCGHARSLSAAEAAARRAAPPVLQRRVSGPPFFSSVGSTSLRSFLSCCCCSPCRPGSSAPGSPPPRPAPAARAVLLQRKRWSGHSCSVRGRCLFRFSAAASLLPIDCGRVAVTGTYGDASHMNKGHEQARSNKRVQWSFEKG